MPATTRRAAPPAAASTKGVAKAAPATPQRPQKKRKVAVSASAAAAGAAAARLPRSEAEAEQVLRQFDHATKFGPCAGVSRVARYNRAVRLQLAPPPAVLAILVSDEYSKLAKSVWDQLKTKPLELI